MTKNNVKREGIVHFWNLPNNKIHVVLNSKFKEKLTKELMKLAVTKANASRLTGIAKTTIRRYINKEHTKIRIDLLLKIINVINKEKFDLNNVEKNIRLIGDFRSPGIINPNLPFNFNSREGARFLAAICNEGWISDNAYYSNSKKDLRDSVKRDTLSVFGGNDETIKDWVKEKDRYLAFPSIIRDVLNLITEFKGIKSENNPPIPGFLFKSKELMLGWIEQTIADEGHVKYYPQKYRREIIWRRSFNKNLSNCKLNKGETTMLNKIGIKYDLKNIGTYRTKKGIEKIKLQLRIARRKNLLKLRKFIEIPHKKKDIIFTKMMLSFVRYKEPLRIKNTIINICRNKGYITAKDLARSMNYKNTKGSYKWFKRYVEEGLLIRTQKSYCKEMDNRLVPVKYILSKP
jgi:hypothetical protein